MTVTGVVPKSRVRAVVSSMSTPVNVPSPLSVGPAKPSTRSAPPSSASTSVSRPEPSTMCSISVNVAVNVPSVKLPSSAVKLVRSMRRSSVTADRSSVSP